LAERGIAVLHVSTRGEAPALSFSDALLTGLARDGGLYVPERWPLLSRDSIAAFAGEPYEGVAKSVVGALVDRDLDDETLTNAIRDAYAAFRHPAVCPLTQLDDNLFLVELFHGPTLAFKDVAMQLLARLMDHLLTQRGQRATIVGATSGDTGSAAIAAFGGLKQVDVFILYPHGRISDVQRRQMTTVDAPNVQALAVEGTFDDCQALLKSLFNHHAFRDEIRLSGVNSINWARIVPQVVYYFTAAVALGAPHRQVAFAVPTGNFGDVFSGYVAKRMGLPVANLTVATNANDILARTLASGRYELKTVVPTQSPSMDIQVSSNFERLLFDAHGRDGAAVRRLMASLAQSGAFDIDASALAAMRQDFAGVRVLEHETEAEIRATHAVSGYVLDPHTAVGVAAARRALKRDPRTPMIAIGAAHPAKFGDAVAKATGERPRLPAHLADLLERRERVTILPNDQAKVETFIRSHARAVRGAAA
jgi:threonine synthase